MKLIQGIEIKSSKIVKGEYEFVHFCENQIEIRSKFDKNYVLENDVLEKKLPGNLGSYIYPHDAILCFNNNYKINKNVFKEIMKNATTKIEKYYEKDLIFDVPTNCIEETEEELDVEICANQPSSNTGIAAPQGKNSLSSNDYSLASNDWQAAPV